VDCGAGELHQFGFNTFLGQLAEHVAEQNSSVPAFAGAAVECDDFHRAVTPKLLSSLTARRIAAHQDQTPPKLSAILKSMVTRRAVVASLCAASRLLGRPQASKGGAGNAITIPARLDALQRILIPARINFSDPLWCVLDSGAGSLVDIDQEIATAIGVKPSWEGLNSGPDAERMTRDGRARAILVVAGLNLGAPVVVIKPTRQPGDGVIGMSLFSRYVVELDWEAIHIRLLDAASFRYSGPGHTIPFSLEPRFNYNPCADTILTFAGERIPANLGIDSGFGGSFAWLSKSFVDRHEVFDEVKAFGACMIAKLSIGPVSVMNPILRLARKPGFGGGPEPDGLLGVEFLRRFKVFMDYTRLRIILEPDSPYGHATVV
jgi:hypothetical protein